MTRNVDKLRLERFHVTDLVTRNFYAFLSIVRKNVDGDDMTLFFSNVFKRLRFLQSTRLTERFQNDALANDFTFETILCFNQPFGRFSVASAWLALLIFLFVLCPTEKTKTTTVTTTTN